MIYNKQIYHVTLHRRSGGLIYRFMDTVIEKASADKSMTDIINGITIIKEHKNSVLLHIEPKIWELLLPIMLKYKDEFKIDWEYKIIEADTE